MIHLFTSDLHLTDRDRDSYRFRIFDTLKVQAKNEGADHIWILGDLTDKKDEHSASLVNRICDHLFDLAGASQVHVLCGNHDYVDAADPFFRFLRQAPEARVEFISTPAERRCGKERILCLPHTRDFRRLVRKYKLDRYDLVLIHQPVKGARSEAGPEVDGIPPACLGKAPRVLAGDIHVPQALQNITYCGAPYPVRFGDTYEPRIILLRHGKLFSRKLTTIQKLRIDLSDPREMRDYDLSEGDQIKVNVRLRRSEFEAWDKIRERVIENARSLGVVLCGLRLVEIKDAAAVDRSIPAIAATADPAQVLRAYGRAGGIDPGLMRLGQAILEQTDGKQQQQ